MSKKKEERNMKKRLDPITLDAIIASVLFVAFMIGFIVWLFIAFI